jgi:anti-sigma regulatory factor (Ser/Thr protein kinase)
MDLKNNDNFVSISFSAISYNLAEGNLFQYRLTGFDPDWINAGDRRFANYTNIPSGDYIFELQVANNEGNWNTEVYTVPMTIASPWWATWWFRILALCALVTAGVLAYRFRIAQIRKEARLKTEFDRKIGDVELSALRAQMNPHFIFNCLNSIENYILKNESVKAAEYINDFARLIRLILQNSRSEYVPLKDEVEAIELYLQMESLRFDDKFSYRIDVSSGVETTEIDVPPMLIQPFIENAIWHGLIPKKAPGKITVEISQVNGELICTIEDDGIGREKSREVNASMLKRGKKSMGMLITKNLIDVFNELYHTNATVQIMDLKDEKGNALGTRVELNIPIE